jgi:hypothetical protein
MAVRERDELWERAMRQLAYRERELAELHEDYLALELRHNQTLAYLRRVWDRADLERANRLAKAANE